MSMKIGFDVDWTQIDQLQTVNDLKSRRSKFEVQRRLQLAANCRFNRGVEFQSCSRAKDDALGEKANQGNELLNDVLRVRKRNMTILSLVSVEPPRGGSERMVG